MKGGFRRLVRGESNVDIVGRSKTWAIVSGIVIGSSFIGLFVRELNLGIEFEGGTAVQFPLKTDATVPDIEAALEEFDLGEIKVQIGTRASGEREAVVRTEESSEETLGKVEAAMAEVGGLKTASGQPDLNAVSRQTVGPTWGKQVRQKALRGFIVFLILVTLYISWRFEPKMAAGALLALFHDLVATAGIYALVGFEVTPATVIALLTLMGFSLYDTVVVFDRVRENAPTVGGSSRTTYSQMINRSVNEVMMRSINTSLSSVVPVAGLLFVGVFLFGAVTLKDLALAMFLGTLVSTYSSIFVAVPVLAALKEREPRYRALRAPATADTRAPRVAPAPSVEVEEVETQGPPQRAPVRTAPRPRKSRRGKRR